ncbi:MAG TPA: RNA chaperone Hfq [Methanothrix sp.]|jgi:RNA chaperone Hfq|nr:RNA chaperone Hfq [Methanothrix sp.]
MEMSDDEKPTTRQSLPQFIPKFRGKKVIIRLISGGQPVIGTVEGFNSYEILLQTAKGELLVFKHAIATIEVTEEPRGFRPGT